jgi:hypothetical protein
MLPIKHLKPKPGTITFCFLMTFGIMGFLSCQNNAAKESIKEVSHHYLKIDTLFRQLVKNDKAHGAIAVAEKGDLKHNYDRGVEYRV